MYHTVIVTLIGDVVVVVVVVEVVRMEQKGRVKIVHGDRHQNLGGVKGNGRKKKA